MGLRREELETIRGSVADDKLINYIQRELSISKEMLNGLRSIIAKIDNISETEIGGFIKDLERSKEEVSNIQRELLNYISRLTPALSHREDWIRIISKLNGVVDKFSGIAYRLEYLVRRGWSIPQTVKENIISLSDSVSESIDSFYQALGLMLDNTEKALEQREKVSKMESKADEYFRRSTFSILESNLSIHSIVLLLSIAEMLEDVSDLLNAAADDVYIIMLSLL